MGNHETIDGGPLPIDLEHLSQYTANDPALTRDVLKIYRDQADTWLTMLSGAADLKAWRDAAHTLKGASRAVGAREVARLAEEAEGLAAIDDPARADHTSRISHALSRAVRYTAQLLEDSPFVG